MTLHWWMHWFWVTTLLLIVIGSIGRIRAAPQLGDLEGIGADIVDQHRYGDRQPRAMYFTKTAVVPARANPVENSTDNIQGDMDVDKKPAQNETVTNTTANVQPVTWTPVNSTDSNLTAVASENATQPILADTNTNTNLTEAQNITFASRKRNLTGPDYIKDDGHIEGVSESRIVTERPLSLETALLQTRIPPNIESSRRVIDQHVGGMDTGAIAGISFAALVITALIGSTGFVLYRRRYLNKPQTLNDKCSNPDSSGYLDDSTIRDNSEEMYSLDNDSFLNSLEAMTIQNYWTDTVKHTKL